MPRKPSAPALPPPDKTVPLSKSGTTHLFPKTREDRRSALTHAQITEDLAAFERAGGRIEVLGNTYTFKTIAPNRRGSPTDVAPTDAAPAADAAAPAAPAADTATTREEPDANG